MRRVRQLIFATALPAKKGPGRRGEVSAGAQRLRWNFSVSVPSWRQTNAVGRVRSFFMLCPSSRREQYQSAALTSFCSPSTIDRSYPSNDLPKVVIGFDDVSEVRHRPDYSFGTPSSVAQLPKRIAGTQFTCAKGNQPEQGVVVIAVDPNWICQRCGHPAPAPTAVAAIAAIYLRWPSSAMLAKSG